MMFIVLPRTVFCALFKYTMDSFQVLISVLIGVIQSKFLSSTTVKSMEPPSTGTASHKWALLKWMVFQGLLSAPYRLEALIPTNSEQIDMVLRECLFSYVRRS